MPSIDFQYNLLSKEQTYSTNFTVTQFLKLTEKMSKTRRTKLIEGIIHANIIKGWWFWIKKFKLNKEEKEVEEEIINCNCNSSFDIRCSCFPPMIDELLVYNSQYLPNSRDWFITKDNISWYYCESYKSNWDNCPMKVPNAVYHYCNSKICKYTKKNKVSILGAKYYLKMMGLSKKEIKDAIDIIKTERIEKRILYDF